MSTTDSTGCTSSTRGGPLQTLLFLCENLHNEDQPTSPSLPNLVPLHESLCQAVHLGGGGGAEEEEDDEEESALVSSLEEASTAADGLGKVIDILCGSSSSSAAADDSKLCREILLGPNNDATTTTTTTIKRQLATIQFLLYRSSTIFRHSNRLRGLALVVIPWLLEYCLTVVTVDNASTTTTTTVTKGGGRSRSDQQDMEQEDELPLSIPPFLLELLEAMMDAVFITTSSNASSSEGLQSCLDACSKHQPASSSSSTTTTAGATFDREEAEWSWTVRGRILIRLHTWLLKQSGQDSSSYSNCDKVLEILQKECILMAIETTDATSTISPTRRKDMMVAWLRPMTNDWLPYWQDQCSNKKSAAAAASGGGSGGFHPLWESLWKAYCHHHQQSNSSSGGVVAKSNESLILLSTTSILCSILPSIVEEALPVPTTTTTTTTTTTDDKEGDHDKSSAIPFQQPLMWDLIHTCLRQGILNNQNNNASSLAHQKEYQMLRRRGLYLLRMMIPTSSTMMMINSNKPQQQQQTVASGGGGGGKKNNAKKKGGKKQKQQEDPQVLLWKKYIQVMETLEMETEQHLIEQVWGTLIDLMDACCSYNAAAGSDASSSAATASSPPPPPMSWYWTRLLLARVLTSYDQSMVRKLAIYRFLNGQAGVSLKAKPKQQQETSCGGQQQQQEKGNNNNKKKNSKNKLAAVKKEGAPLTMLPPAFVTDIVVLSFDSLVGSVGTNINMGTDVIDLIPLLSTFLQLYYAALEDSGQRKELLSRLWQPSFVKQLCNKTIVLVWEFMAQAMETKAEQLEIDAEMLSSPVSSLTHLFNTASLIGGYHDSLLGSLASMLRYTKTQQIDPKVILQVLSLFDKVILEAKMTPTTTSEAVMEGKENAPDIAVDELDTNPIHASLQQWLQQLGGTASGAGAESNHKWIAMVASTVAAAFVRGELLASSPKQQQDGGSNNEQYWEPSSGASNLERETSRAIAYLCTLVGRSGKANTDTTAGGLLWPAIHKGMANAPMAMVGTSWIKADVVTRSLLLLEEGCRLQVISGLGNGDLVLDRKTQQMMPPPPNIESLLENAAKFILHHISFLVADDPNKKELAGASRSGDVKKASVCFAYLISQITMFHEAYPSSMAVGKVVDEMLTKSLDALKSEAAADAGAEAVKNTALAYASLSCGGSLSGTTQLLEACRLFLGLEFRKIPGMKKSQEQIGRSVFYYAKWGTLSCLLPRMVRESGSEVESFLAEFRKAAFGAVHGIPADALLAFFQCILVAAQREMSTPASGGEEEKAAEVDPSLIAEFIDALMALMEEKTSSKDSNYMLNEFCGLLFQPGLLLQEWQRLKRDPTAAETPIRDAYRRLMKLAGNVRPRISRVVLCRVAAGWLGPSPEGSEVNTQGMGAISFRQDIIDLMFFKEAKMDVTTANQTTKGRNDFDGAFQLPDGIHESSVGRGYPLIFFSKLPDPGQGLHPDVLKLLIHYTILGLLDKICSDTTKKGGNKLLMLGSEEYINKIRGWQALCALSRFVTEDIIEPVSKKVFQAMGESLHQQIRYFLEVFTLQIARKHPAVVGRALLVDINKRDLTLQHVTSVMIVIGNLIVGRYKLDFFTQYEGENKQEAVPLKRILAGTIPWLGSTQGFSRGIAQLLTHMLIPMVVDADALKKTTDAELSKGEGSNWFLISIYRFLDENQEMKRLRQKSSKFFDSYAVDEVCTPEGLLTIQVDEGGDAFPTHLVETMKQTLQEVYEDLKLWEKDVPQWTALEKVMLENQGGDGDESDAGEEEEEEEEEDALVNFQRKIIPLDELNLALLTLKERRLRNLAGRKKQRLIVCASLIDKVPNLGGLARTSEIFSAEKLVIPDIGVTKMDNFQALSVGAGDWIDIEECKEQNLLEFLRAHRAKGYFIVGTNLIIGFVGNLPLSGSTNIVTVRKGKGRDPN